MLPAGRSRQTFEMQVRDPRLWFPWDHGEPNLYTLTVKAQRDGRTLDRVTESVGLREITLRAQPRLAAGSGGLDVRRQRAAGVPARRELGSGGCVSGARDRGRLSRLACDGARGEPERAARVGWGAAREKSVL